MNSRAIRTIGTKGAFSLIEVTLALGVTAFCLVAILGLLPVGLSTSKTSIEQTAANGILSAVISDLRATPPTRPRGQAAESQEFSIPIPANPVSSADSESVTLFFNGDGQITDDLGVARFRLTAQFLPNAEERAATFVNLRVGWPAAVDPAQSPSAEYVEMFTALDRN